VAAVAVAPFVLLAGISVWGLRSRSAATVAPSAPAGASIGMQDRTGLWAQPAAAASIAPGAASVVAPAASAAPAVAPVEAAGGFELPTTTEPKARPHRSRASPRPSKDVEPAAAQSGKVKTRIDNAGF
jgi:hypothetical protein